MNAKILQKLLEINQTFYNQFSESFSTTRHQAQSGTDQFAQEISSTESVLDVGCGNGTFARALVEKGFSGRYLGIDLSEGLLERARALTSNTHQAEISFVFADLANPSWADHLPTHAYDWLVCFAVLHHIPGEELRQQIVYSFRRLLAKGGKIAISTWQWQNSARLFTHVLPWSTVGINPEDVDEGDVLLDWRAGESPGVRYVHTFSETTLSHLAESCGFSIENSFLSDGKTGNLALYQVWTSK
jgi:2-polyprenyl-3-methyl-5-hydroxy-6-metoxy-1,4-benzoquinol methylase